MNHLKRKTDISTLKISQLGDRCQVLRSYRRSVYDDIKSYGNMMLLCCLRDSGIQGDNSLIVLKLQVECSVNQLNG